MPLDAPIGARFDVSREQDRLDGRASRQWATRPMDERFVSLDELIASLQERTNRSTARTVRLGSISATMIGSELGFDLDGVPVEPTNYSFNQLCQEIGAPAGYLSKMAGNPALAVQCLEYGFRTAEDTGREVGVLETTALATGKGALRGVTGPNYGRIWDLEVAEAVKKMTDRSGARWEVPTAFRTADGRGAFGKQYQCVDPTRDSTTLYAGDRDIFLFMVDQRNPIEAGHLPDGSPDLFFRGFYAWNGECGGVSNGVGTFLYRYVCENRNIWGQRGFQRISINHTKNAAERFVGQLLPALENFVNGSTDGIVSSIEASRRARIARDDDERFAFLTRLDFGPKEAVAIMQRCIDEEGRPIETLFDAQQAITAYARGFGNQDRRVDLERQAGKLMDLVVA